MFAEPDGRLVMLHDAKVDRTTDGHGLVSELSFDQVRRLDAGAWFSPAFAGERVPTLDELFDLADGASIALCLEVKTDSSADQAALACEIAGEIATRGRLAVDALASFEHSALAEAARAVPGVRCAHDRLPERGPADGRALIAQAALIGARIVQHHHADLTAEAVAEAQGAGVEIWAWPANTSQEIERVLEFGVAGVMGDDVAAIVACVATGGA